MRDLLDYSHCLNRNQISKKTKYSLSLVDTSSIYLLRGRDFK